MTSKAMSCLGDLMKFKFAEPKAEQYEKDQPVRDDHSKEEIIELAMEAFEWKESKCLSWYKLQIPQLNGNSPMELVQRGQTSKIIDFLDKRHLELKKNQKAAQEREMNGEKPTKK